MKREIKLKVFVSVLFIIIVTGVSTVLTVAKHKQYQVELGKKIIVHEDTRKIRFMDKARQDIFTGHFGLGIPKHAFPYDCSVDKLRNASLCLRWKEKAELHIDYWEKGTSKCYNVEWKSLNKETLLKDCFGLDQGDALWYGGWISKDQTWPMRNISVPLQPFITGQLHGQDTFGPVLERYWLSSKGVAVFSADLTSPLHMSWNASNEKTNDTEGDGQLCLVSDYDHPVYGVRQGHRPTYLKYSVCVSDDILDVHRLALRQISEKRNISLDNVRNMAFLKAPVWSAARALGENITQAGLGQLGQRLAKLNVPIGVLLIEDKWQAHHGDVDFNMDTFTDGPAVLRNLRAQLNCTIALGVDPYISIHSKNFEEAASEGYLVTDAGGDAPGLFKIYDPTSTQFQVVGALDLTSPAAVDWFKDKMDTLKNTTSISVFNFQGGEASLLPFAATLSANQTNPNFYTHDYGVVAEETGLPAIVDSVTHLQGHPLIVRLQISGLANTIPTVLTLSILGYPLVLPEIQTPSSKDLYIRAIQLSAFMPLMHVGTPPDMYDQETVDVVRTMEAVHRTLVHPIVVSGNVSSVNPIIRPLWWISPSDPIARELDSEFLVGDDLLVAPILEEGAVRRDVYLPQGTWVSNNGVETIGPTWLRDYSIPLTSFAYFKASPGRKA